MLDWLTLFAQAIPEEGYLIMGMLLQMTVFSIMSRFNWTATYMLPITRKLVQRAGWRGVLMSLGLSFVPDAVHSPVGLLKGVVRKPIEEDTPTQRRARIREARKNPGSVIVENPKNLQEAMLNAVLKGQVADYTLHRAAGETPATIQATLLLDKRDTPWLL
jgi:hypothetical protein